MTTVEIGNMYEDYILKILKEKYDNIWLTKDVPENIVKKCNFPMFKEQFTHDIGFDILGIKNEKITFIQCKNYSSSTICQHDLGGFHTFIVHTYNEINEYIVYYNGKLSNKILPYVSSNKLNIKYINIGFNNNISENINNLQFIPTDYQVEAYEKLKNNSRSILSMPCGMGKTYISYLLGQDYDNIIIFSHLKAHAIQILNTFKNYSNNKYNNILISSDVVRGNIKFELKNIISITYDSCKILNKNIDKLEKPFIIIDEFHNLSKNDLNGTTEIGNLIKSKHNILFVSATPKNNIFYKDMVIYEYKWKDAINNGYLSDYKIYYPEANILNNYCKNQFKKILNTNILEEEYCKAYNILYGLLKNNHKKCIIYCNTKIYCNKLKIAIEFVNLYFLLKINISILNSNISKKTRQLIINNFIDGPDVQIICNVHILDEAVNIPKCDSVYIISNSLNIIKIIQRACRCNRKIDNKIAGIYLWSDNINKIKDIIINTFNDNTRFIEMKYNFIHMLELLPNKLLTNDTSSLESLSNISFDNNIFKNKFTFMSLYNFLIKNKFYCVKFLDDFNVIVCDNYNSIYKSCIIPYNLLNKWIFPINNNEFINILNENFEKNIDYKICPVNKYLLSICTIKKICLSTPCKESFQLIHYFFNLEQSILSYKNYLIKELSIFK